MGHVLRGLRPKGSGRPVKSGDRVSIKTLMGDAYRYRGTVREGPDFHGQVVVEFDGEVGGDEKTKLVPLDHLQPAPGDERPSGDAVLEAAVERIVDELPIRADWNGCMDEGGHLDEVRAMVRRELVAFRDDNARGL